MAQLLSGKVAAITGGVTGIGRALALEYVRQGASVVVNHFDDEASARNFESLRKEALEANSDARISSLPGDVSKQGTASRLIEAVVSRYGKLDIFVSNAGVCKFADFLR